LYSLVVVNRIGRLAAATHALAGAARLITTSEELLPMASLNKEQSAPSQSCLLLQNDYKKNELYSLVVVNRIGSLR
jgi:hypothetical protein